MRFAHRQARLVVALVALACAMPAAAGASAHAAFREASFCGVAKSFALSLQKAPTTQSLAASQSQLKTNLTKIAAAKGSLIAAAPARLKGDLGNVIGLYGQLRADLAKTNWSLVSLAKSPTTMGALLAEAKKDQPSFAQLKQYLTKTCHY
jgi:hypothetical protein